VRSALHRGARYGRGDRDRTRAGGSGCAGHGGRRMSRLLEIAPELITQTGIMLQIVGLGMLIGGAAGLVVGTGLYVTRGGGILAQPLVFWTVNLVVNNFRPIPFIIFMAA